MLGVVIEEEMVCEQRGVCVWGGGESTHTAKTATKQLSTDETGTHCSVVTPDKIQIHFALHLLQALHILQLQQACTGVNISCAFSMEPHLQCFTYKCNPVHRTMKNCTADK